MNMIKVSSKSKPNNVAGALANIIKDNKEVEVQVVGAGAINQLIKAIIICRGYLAPIGINVVCIPSFSTVKIDNIDKTGIKILIKSL